MNERPLTRRVLSVLLLASLLTITVPVQGDVSIPDFPHTPEGWLRWIPVETEQSPVETGQSPVETGQSPVETGQSLDGQRTVWLPEGADAGEQRVFLMLAAGDLRDAWLPAWLGGADVLWKGTLEAGGVAWSWKIADDGEVRGLVAVSESGDWTLGALAPAGEWEAYSQAFNEILRGAP